MNLPWIEHNLSPNGNHKARDIARRIRIARGIPSLRAALSEGIEFARLSKKQISNPFVRQYAKLIYRAVLTRREQLEVRIELRSWQRSLKHYPPDEDTPDWQVHASDTHWPLGTCSQCYGDLILSILNRRKVR